MSRLAVWMRSRARPVSPAPSRAASSLDDIKRRFVEEVKLRAYDNRYLDVNEEREILQFAILQGVTVDSARAALVQVCEANGYVLESRVRSEVKELIAALTGDAGRLGEKEFHEAVKVAQKKCQGRLDEVHCTRMVIQLIEDSGLRVKEGMFNRWYARVKAEVG